MWLLHRMLYRWSIIYYSIPYYRAAITLYLPDVFICDVIDQCYYWEHFRTRAARYPSSIVPSSTPLISSVPKDTCHDQDTAREICSNSLRKNSFLFPDVMKLKDVYHIVDTTRPLRLLSAIVAVNLAAAKWLTRIKEMEAKSRAIPDDVSWSLSLLCKYRTLPDFSWSFISNSHPCKVFCFFPPPHLSQVSAPCKYNPYWLSPVVPGLSVIIYIGAA